MGTTLTGTTPQDTYDSLIKVTDNGPLSSTVKYLTDGLGNDSALAVSTARVGIGTTSNYSFNDDAKLAVANTSGNSTISIVSSTTGTGYLAFADGTSGTDRYTGSINYNHSTNAMTLHTNAGNERMIITSAGNVGIGTSSPAGNLHIASASDTGIRIQAGTSSLSYIDLADSASGTPAGSIAYNHIVDAIVFGVGGSNTERFRMTANGLCFNGDTAAANALDDYEEGTFTPTTATSGYTISASNGIYTKIGRQVTIRANFTFSAVNVLSTSAVTIGGLPFTNPTFQFVGTIREATASGAAYTAAVTEASTSVFCNSMDGVVTGSQRPFGISENYVLAITYFV